MALSKKSMTLLIIIIVMAAIIGMKLYQGSQAKPVESNEARSKGPKDAKVKIIEFIDFQCPACAYGFGILDSYVKKYPQDIHLQVKYFPLIRAHRHAMVSAMYNECAARQGKFWEVAGPMMEAQSQWSELISAEGTFTDLAKNANMNLEQLKQCLENPDAKQAVEDDRLLGSSMQIQSTPTYFINNKMVVGGKALEEELKTYFPGGV